MLNETFNFIEQNTVLLLKTNEFYIGIIKVIFLHGHIAP